MYNKSLLQKKINQVSFKKLYSKHVRSGDFVTFNLIDFNKNNIWKTTVSGLLIGKSINLIYILRNLNRISILYKLNLNSLNLTYLNKIKTLIKTKRYKIYHRFFQVID